MKVVLGMSGGVDSAAAAYLLKEAGHTVVGVTLVMKQDVLPDIDGAKQTAEKLGIRHEVLDCTCNFKKFVLDDFANEYRLGNTPNPCIVCNPNVKFAAMLDFMRQISFDAVATGHYAHIRKNEQSGKYELLRGKDAMKDQSYMLYRLSQEQLSHILFPLADMEKTEIRSLAAKAGILAQIPKDSQDICFLPNGDYAAFLTLEYGMKPQKGAFQLADGTVVGIHDGQWKYTVGQRKGLGIACGYPVYVTGKNAVNNLVSVGKEEELYASECRIVNCNWITMPQGQENYTAKVRYSRREAGVKVSPLSDSEAILTFSEPQRAMTLGQSAVIYSGDLVIGGGMIAQVIG